MKYLSFLSIIFTLNSYASITLKDSLESALKNNQVDNINAARSLQVTEQKRQSYGNYFPKIALKGTYLLQENLVNQKSYGLNLTHSLYKGGRDQEAIQASKDAIVVSENLWSQERLMLYQNVIQVYYNYFLSLNDYYNLDLLKKQSLERTNEIRNRVKIGRSRLGEVLQAEAQLASVDAQLLSGESLKKENEDKFFLLTGLPRSSMFDTNLIEVFEDKRTLSDYLELAKDRPDLMNKEIKISQTNHELIIAKKVHFPTLDLTSNYYLNSRVAPYKNTYWDAGLVLTVPLYEGGVTESKVRENLQKKEEAIFSKRDYQKGIELDLTSKFQTYHRFVDQIKAYDLALSKAKKNYDESIKDYRLGLVSNLDVLSALNLYLDSKRNSEKTKIQAMMNLKLLEVSAGLIQ